MIASSSKEIEVFCFQENQEKYIYICGILSFSKDKIRKAIQGRDRF
ncbi:MAG: hypothetical protein F6K39_28095 [Okeania sp. SIO3B3]|nr:hypothetical protein [Okeania sp. SIO3B3]